MHEIHRVGKTEWEDGEKDRGRSKKETRKHHQADSSLLVSHLWFYTILQGVTGSQLRPIKAPPPSKPELMSCSGAA